MTSPTSPMLEKLARAIGEADGVVWTDGYVQYRSAECDPDESVPQQYARLARVALQSLLPPDEGTVEAMLREWWAHSDDNESMRGAFTAAIEHMLKGGE